MSRRPAQPRAYWWLEYYHGEPVRQVQAVEADKPLLVDARGNAIRRAAGFVPPDKRP